MITILKQIPFFASLDEKIHKALIRNIELRYYPAHYTLFNEWDVGEFMYIIKNGEIGIFKNKADQNPIATLTSNYFFGEMALISKKKRNATAKTLTDVEVFVLHKGAFDELMRTNPEIANNISNEIIRRLNENIEKFGEDEEEFNRSIFN